VDEDLPGTSPESPHCPEAAVFIATVILSLLLAAVFTVAGIFKIVKNPSGADMADHLGFPMGGWKVIGWLEILAALGLLVGLYYAPIGEGAALGLALLMLGAVISHMRVRDAFSKVTLPLGLGVLAVITLLLRVETV
jgi:uncharacterized membrane protein YphA (DoxX/SURF4 family)